MNERCSPPQVCLPSAVCVVSRRLCNYFPNPAANSATTMTREEPTPTVGRVVMTADSDLIYVRFCPLLRGSRRLSPEVQELKSAHWLSLWRNFGEILNHGCKSVRSDFHRAGERMINFHNGQQAGKD
jgi:hypothetical protein